MARKNARAPGVEREVKRPEMQWAMKARPNWDDIDPMDFDDSPDRMSIPPELVPDGMSMQWVTDIVLGQPFPEHRAQFEKRGWTPVHPEDFEGRFRGVFTPKEHDGEIRMTGSVLMARPKYLTDRARQVDRRAALEQVAIKEQAITGGDMKVSLDSQHPSALNSNRIRKSYERITIPQE